MPEFLDVVNIIGVIGTVLISIVIAGLISFLLPDILQLADNLISIMSPKA